MLYMSAVEVLACAGSRVHKLTDDFGADYDYDSIFRRTLLSITSPPVRNETFP